MPRRTPSPPPTSSWTGATSGCSRPPPPPRWPVGLAETGSEDSTRTTLVSFVSITLAFSCGTRWGHTRHYIAEPPRWLDVSLWRVPRRAFSLATGRAVGALPYPSTSVHVTPPVRESGSARAVHESTQGGLFPGHRQSCRCASLLVHICPRPPPVSESGSAPYMRDPWGSAMPSLRTAPLSDRCAGSGRPVIGLTGRFRGGACPRPQGGVGEAVRVELVPAGQAPGGRAELAPPPPWQVVADAYVDARVDSGREEDRYRNVR